MCTMNLQHKTSLSSLPEQLLIKTESKKKKKKGKHI